MILCVIFIRNVILHHRLQDHRLITKLVLIRRKPSFSVLDQVRLNSACSAKETTDIEVLHVASLTITFKKENQYGAV